MKAKPFWKVWVHPENTYNKSNTSIISGKQWVDIAWQTLHNLNIKTVTLSIALNYKNMGQEFCYESSHKKLLQIHRDIIVNTTEFDLHDHFQKLPVWISWVKFDLYFFLLFLYFRLPLSEKKISESK